MSRSRQERALRCQGPKPEEGPLPWPRPGMAVPNGGARRWIRTDPPEAQVGARPHSRGGLDQLWLLPPQEKCQVHQTGHGGLSDPAGTRRDEEEEEG